MIHLHMVTTIIIIYLESRWEKPSSYKKVRKNNLGLMSRETALTIPEVKTTFELLPEAVANVVWETVGGRPSELFKLQSRVQKEGVGSAVGVANVFVCDLLSDAINSRDKMLAEHPELADICILFAKHDEVPAALLREKGIKRPVVDKVLRDIKHPGGAHVLVPSTPAMKVVLRHMLTAPPTFEQLSLLCAELTPDPNVEPIVVSTITDSSGTELLVLSDFLLPNTLIT